MKKISTLYNNDNLYTFYNISTDKYLKIIETKYITDDVIKITKIKPTNNILPILYDVFYPQKNIHFIATEWQPFGPPNWQERKYLQCEVTDIKDASYFFLRQTELFQHTNKNYILLNYTQENLKHQRKRKLEKINNTIIKEK